MKYLLDTHAVIWIARDEKFRFSDQGAALLIADPGLVYVSAVTAWEMGAKNRIGKLPGMENFLKHFEARVEFSGFRPLSISTRHSLLAAGLEGTHKDPFDRFLASQALLEDLVLLSKDALLDSFGIKRFW